MKDRADFGRYGKSFQEGFCQLILEDRPFADQISEVLDINFLELKYLQVFVKKILQYRQKYGTHPTYKLMLTIFRAEIGNENNVIQKQVRDYFARIYKTDVDGELEDYQLAPLNRKKLLGAFEDVITGGGRKRFTNVLSQIKHSQETGEYI